jgi:hypothetical protein
MHHVRREGHRPKHGEDGQGVRKKSEALRTLKDGGKPRKAWKDMDFKRVEK